MGTFRELYNRLVDAALRNDLEKEVREITESGEYGREEVDRLLHPMEHPVVMRTEDCKCPPWENCEQCAVECLFSAIDRDENGNVVISTADCTGCGICVEECKNKVLTDRKEIIPVLELLNARKRPVYAMIAPAFNGQFSMDVTAGKLRTAFKLAGFYGMIEVALFADILTLKEALEFDRSIHTDKDYMLTSCCCPIWVVMIKKIYHELIPHMPPSVSPMVACGRAIKRIHPEAVTVFIGPCVAKKAEAREADISDAVDYVLTFQEISDVFQKMSIDPSALPEDMRDHSSRGGRIYARTGGVSEAVQDTLNRLKPERNIKLKAIQADGAADCKRLLKEVMEGNIKANFMEGMGCRGGCVGGPKAIIDKELGTIHANQYGDNAIYPTPIDNPHVIHLLERLGFHTIESLLESDNLFTRKFE
ncbi:MAG: 4Fe-4S binding protein [Clostridiaceae bacterium]|jgi:iron only hydrogenase large subunit-like protein|nr:[Fe-Fe] hydrogenase large subunit C-terminal domain-containing protein [Bacillota bacterium]NLI38697.1 4Fe-4S binding protein [Clostridiaceae bacterium]